MGCSERGMYPGIEGDDRFEYVWDNLIKTFNPELIKKYNHRKGIKWEVDNSCRRESKIWYEAGNKGPRFSELEARLVVHNYEFIGVGIGLYRDIMESIAYAEEVEQYERLKIIKVKHRRQGVYKKEIDEELLAKWEACRMHELEFNYDDELNRKPKEFRRKGELNNVQKKNRKKTNRKKKRRR